MKTLSKVDYKKGEEKATFEAVWRYLLDHSEINHEGTMFVKFHCRSKAKFKRAIAARMRGLYRHPEWAEPLMKERQANVLEQSRMNSALAKVKKANENIKRPWWSKLRNTLKTLLLN